MTQFDFNECASEQFHKADARLNTIYRKVLDSLQKDLTDARKENEPDQIKYVHQAIEKLKAAEKVWIRYRALHCEAARHQVEGGSMSRMVWSSCMAETANHRIDELKSTYELQVQNLE